MEVQYDFLGAVFGNSGTKGFIHLLDLGCPDCSRQRRLHGDVARAVARVAINLNLLKAIPAGQFRSRNGIGGHLVVRILHKFSGHRLEQASQLGRGVITFFKFRMNDASRHRQAERHKKNHSHPAFHICPASARITDHDFLSLNSIPKIPT